MRKQPHSPSSPFSTLAGGHGSPLSRPGILGRKEHKSLRSPGGPGSILSPKHKSVDFVTDDGTTFSPISSQSTLGSGSKTNVSPQTIGGSLSSGGVPNATFHSSAVQQQIAQQQQQQPQSKLISAGRVASASPNSISVASALQLLAGIHPSSFATNNASHVLPSPQASTSVSGVAMSTPITSMSAVETH